MLEDEEEETGVGLDPVPEWEKPVTVYDLDMLDPDKLLSGIEGRPWPEENTRWTRDDLVRHYAEVVDMETWFQGRSEEEIEEGYKADAEQEGVTGKQIEMSLDVPEPDETGKVVLRSGWLQACIEKGRLFIDGKYGGWIVK